MNIRDVAKEWTESFGSAEAALEQALSLLHFTLTRYRGKISAGLVREPPESLLPMKVTADGPPVIAEFPAGTDAPHG